MNDSDGYPSDDELKYIKEFDCMSRPLKMLVEYMQERWQWDEYFIITEKMDDCPMQDAIDALPYHHKYKVLHISTGGWSGHEDIIQALHQNQWFWMLYWQSEQRGGHYVFEIPIESWDS